MQVRANTIEQKLIEKLGQLKYTLRPDTRDRAANAFTHDDDTLLHRRRDDQRCAMPNDKETPCHA